MVIVSHPRRDREGYDLRIIAELIEAVCLDVEGDSLSGLQMVDKGPQTLFRGHGGDILQPELFSDVLTRTESLDIGEVGDEASTLTRVAHNHRGTDRRYDLRP